MSNKQLRTRLSSWEQRGDLLRQKKMAVDLDFRMRWWWSGYVPSGACHSGLDQRPSSAAQKVFVWLSELRGAASQHVCPRATTHGHGTPVSHFLGLCMHVVLMDVVAI